MLIDTSGWLGVYHKREPQHIEAVKIYKSAWFRITHSYILAEFAPLAQVRGLPRPENLAFCRGILDDPNIEIIWVDEVLHRRAVELLQRRDDKNYSLCDAVSFVIMNEHGINEALTTDKHFEQENFVRLLKP